MTPNDVLNIINLILNPLFIYKVAAILISIAYIVFAFIVYRRVNTMNKVLTHDIFSHVLFVISLIHLAVAFSLFLIAVAIL